MDSCPICTRPVLPRAQNKAFPFCSPRCRQVDLGCWLDEKYRIAVGDGSALDGPSDGRPLDGSAVDGSASDGSALDDGHAAGSHGDAGREANAEACADVPITPKPR